MIKIIYIERVVEFKGVKEFAKNFLFSLLALDDIGVFLAIVHSLYVIDVQSATSVSVHNSESLFSQVFSKLVHLASDCSQELIVADLA
jgi:hypothetical protein